jgi:hypothetical protein
LAALRAVIAMVFALSLTLEPLPAAQAMKAVHTDAGMSAPSNGMPDCHKAHKAHKANHREMPRDCGCCGDLGKSQCPGEGCACLFKCGAQTLALYAEGTTLRFVASAEFHSIDPVKPPGAGVIPAGPPPRA